MSTINAYASPDAHVIYGAAYDDSLGDEIRVNGGGYRPVAPQRTPPAYFGGRAACVPARTTSYQMPVARCRWGAVGSAVGGRWCTGGDYGSMSVPSVWRTTAPRPQPVWTRCRPWHGRSEIPRSCANR